MLQAPKKLWERWWQQRTGRTRYEVAVHPAYTLIVHARTPREAAMIALSEAFARYGRRAPVHSPLYSGRYEVLAAARMLRVRALNASNQETLWPVEEIAAALGYGRPFGLG
jgi:hypothetical protein